MSTKDPKVHVLENVPSGTLWPIELEFWENREDAFNARVALGEFFKNRKFGDFLYIITITQDPRIVLINRFTVSEFAYKGEDGAEVVEAEYTFYNEDGEIIKRDTNYYRKGDTVYHFIADMYNLSEDVIGNIQPPDWMKPF